MQDRLKNVKMIKLRRRHFIFCFRIGSYEFASYNYDQRDWAPDLKRRADSTDTKNRDDPIAMHTHPLVIPIFWPTKRSWEGQCVYMVLYGGYGRVALESWLIQLSHNCYCLKLRHPETRILFRIYLAFPMALDGELLSERWGGMCKTERPEHSRQVSYGGYDWETC